MNKAEAISVLGLSNFPSKIEVKKAFREKAKLLHPDQTKDKDSEEAFILAYEAYTFLMNDSFDKNAANQKKNPNHFRNQNHFSRHQQQQREWYASTFEERLKKAKTTSEKLENERSQRIYNQALIDYQNSWQRKAMVIITILSFVCISIFSFDALEKSKMKVYSRFEYKINVDDINKPSYFYITIANQDIEITPDMYLLLKKEPASFIVYQTPIMKDIVEIKALFTNTNETVKLIMPINVYSSFPLIEIILLIPFLSFFVERPKFSFVFTHVYFSLYIIPALIVMLWLLNNRFLRLMDLL